MITDAQVHYLIFQAKLPCATPAGVHERQAYGEVAHLHPDYAKAVTRLTGYLNGALALETGPEVERRVKQTLEIESQGLPVARATIAAMDREITILRSSNEFLHVIVSSQEIELGVVRQQRQLAQGEQLDARQRGSQALLEELTISNDLLADKSFVRELAKLDQAIGE